MTFDSTGDGTFDIQFAPVAGELSTSATITGDANVNTLQFSNVSAGIDLSGFTFNSWTAGTDRVLINTSGGGSTYIGSSVDDTFQTIRNGSTVVGLGGDEIFQLDSTSLPAAVHGSAADGTGGGSETDLIDPLNNIDMGGFTFTNIDGFSYSQNGFIGVDFFTGAINSSSRVASFDATQLGTDLPTNLIVTSANSLNAALAVNIDTVGGTLDASLWNTTGAGASSRLHTNGSTGNDTITGWNLNDIVVLGGGADTVSTGDGDDEVFLDDTASGGALDGGGGTNDRLTMNMTASLAALTFTLLDAAQTSAGPGGMTITGFEEFNFFGGSGDDVVAAGEGRADLRGNDGNDTLTGGGAGSNVLDGGAGTDTLDDNGSDFASLRGGDDNDTLISQQGATGTDIRGGVGDDLAIVDRGDLSASLTVDVEAIALGSTANLADGTSIRDIEQIQFTAGSGNDELVGGAFDDILRGGAGRDELSGRDGNDQLFGGDGLDIIDGGAGLDIIDGGAGIDLIDGGADADTISGGLGADQLDGGGGDDTIIFDVFDTVIDGGTGTDTGDASAETADLTLNLAAHNLENLTAGSGNDTITGTAGDNILNGGDGNDTLNGGAGADDLDGGGGNDNLIVDADDTSYVGGAGNDFILIDATSAAFTLTLTDAMSFERAYGNDNVNTIDASATTGQQIIFGRDGNDTLTGSSAGDFLFGEDGNDTLNGGAGADFLLGGAGTDTLNGGDLNDRLYGGNDGDTLNGDDGNDLLIGEGGADTFNGGAGNDVMLTDDLDISFNGGSGTDILSVQVNTGVNYNLSSSLIERAFGRLGNDTFDASGASHSMLMVGNDGNDVLLAGSGFDSLVGGDGNDTLDGGGSNDLIAGNDGIDILSGGAGADQLNGGAGADLFRMFAGAQTEIVLDWQDGIDTIDFSLHAGVNSMADLNIQEINGHTGVFFGPTDVVWLLNQTGVIDVGDFAF